MTENLGLFRHFRHQSLDHNCMSPGSCKWLFWANQHSWVWCEWIGPIQEQSDDIMSGWVPYSIHRYPYFYTGPTALIVHNLLGNKGKVQHSELHYFRYPGAVGFGRTAGRELLFDGVWIWRCCSPYKNLIQTCDWVLSTGLFTPPSCKRNFSGMEALCWQYPAAAAWGAWRYIDNIMYNFS